MYTHTSLGDLQSALAQRLGDPANVFWSAAENYRYVVEALRVWNAYSQYYRERGALTVDVPAGGNFFIDVLESMPNLIPTVTDRDLILQIENHLIEPENALAWSGTDQFTYELIVDSLTRRRNQFLLETGMVVSQSGDIGSVPPPDGRYQLDDRTIDVRRAAWKDLDDAYTTLWRTDEEELGNWNRGWSNPAGQPSAYSIAISPPLSMQLAPPPNDSGSLNLLTVSTGPVLTPQTAATVLGIPDDFCWVIKWGVLEDLLSNNSPNVDLARAAYCRSRWEEGIFLARISASVLSATINDVPVEIGPLQALDQYRAGWQNSTPAAPYSLVTAGWNLFMPFPIPDGVYGATFDAIRNFPIPTQPGNFVQIGREFVDMIVDYAVHLASFKMGGSEFTTSKPGYDNLVKLAARQNEKLRANSSAFQVLQSKEQAEGRLHPRETSDTGLQAMNYAK